MANVNTTDDQSSTLQTLAGILRVDLKLGPDAVIEEDMPLMEGDHDLDSLDILLLVTSIEKRFGIKIPNEEVGRDAFETVGTLAAYIDKARE